MLILQKVVLACFFINNFKETHVSLFVAYLPLLINEIYLQNMFFKILIKNLATKNIIEHEYDPFSDEIASPCKLFFISYHFFYLHNTG